MLWHVNFLLISSLCLAWRQIHLFLAVLTHCTHTCPALHHPPTHHSSKRLSADFVAWSRKTMERRTQGKSLLPAWTLHSQPVRLPTLPSSLPGTGGGFLSPRPASCTPCMRGPSCALQFWGNRHVWLELDIFSCMPLVLHEKRRGLEDIFALHLQEEGFFREEGKGKSDEKISDLLIRKSIMYLLLPMPG